MPGARGAGGHPAEPLVGRADERAPLVLDDVTVQSDRQRKEAILELLRDVSKERQVILFTQELEVVSWGRPDSRTTRTAAATASVTDPSGPWATGEIEKAISMPTR